MYCTCVCVVYILCRLDHVPKFVQTTPINHTSQVRTWKMHLYTLIQLLVIGLLWGLKLSKASMVYPLVIVFLIPLKFILGKFVFTKREMEAVSLELHVLTGLALSPGPSLRTRLGRLSCMLVKLIDFLSFPVGW